MLLGDDAAEGLIYIGVVLLTKLIAQLTYDLDHLADIVIFIQGDAGNIREGNIGKTSRLLFFGKQDLLELCDRLVDLRDTHAGLDSQIRAPHLYETDHLLQGRIAVADSRAFDTDSALGHSFSPAGCRHMHLIAHFHVEFNVGKRRNTSDDILDKSAEFVRHHDARGIAQRDLVGARFDCRRDGVTEETFLCPCRVQCGKLYKFTVITALFHLFRDQ